MFRPRGVFFTVIPVFNNSPGWFFGVLEASEWKELIDQ
jgi:hypothetical protein